MKRAIITIAALLIAAVAARSESSLSALGYGWQSETASIRAAGMGLTSIGTSDSLSLDLMAPAAWSGPGTTRFGFGSWVGGTTAKDVTGSDDATSGGFTGAGFAVHLGRGIFAGITILPYTQLNYRWRSDDSLGWSPTTIQRQGDGGLSQVVFGVSFPINPELRLGVNVRPVFGKVQRLWGVSFPGLTDHGASETVSDRFQGYGFGLSGVWSMGDWGAGINFQTPFKATIERQMVVIGGTVSQVDTTIRQAGKLGLPMDLTVGASRQLGRNLFAVEAALHGWKSVALPAGSTAKLTDGTRLSAGWEWAPESQPLDPLWKQLIYRAGAYETNSYALSASGHQPQRFAFTAGMGIPYADGKSRVDLAIEVGFGGNQGSDGASERSFGLSIAFNHSEPWFVQRQDQ